MPTQQSQIMAAPEPAADRAPGVFTARTSCPACRGVISRCLYECRYDEPPISDYVRHYYEAVGIVEMERLRGANYRLLQCGDCGLVYQQEVPDDALLERLYEHWIDPELAKGRDRQRRELASYSMHAQEILQLLTALGRPRDVRVLDFGMGWGDWASMARALGCETFGVEISRSRIEHARELGIPVVDPGRLADERFDLINAEQVFEHLPEPLETLRTLASALRPGGLIKVCVPNGRSIVRRLRRADWSAPRDTRRSLHAVQPLEHLNCFDHAALVAMGHRAGLRVAMIPMITQYACSTDWRRPGRILRNLIYPIYRNLLGRGTWVVFRRSGN